MRLGLLWDLPTESRMKWTKRRSRILRFYVEITADGFDPDLLGPLANGRTYREVIDLGVRHAIELMPCFARHDPGETDGTGFHRRREPVMDVGIINTFASSFLTWLDSEQPDAEIHALGDSNEFDFLPNLSGSPEPTYKTWFKGFQAIRKHAGGLGVPIVVGGTRAFRRSRSSSRGPTLSEWVMDRLNKRASDVVFDVHGNGMSDAEFRDHLEFIHSRGFRVGCYEDVGQQRADIRARIALNAGAGAYFTFGRWGEPKWGVVKSNKSDTSDLGIQGPGDIWNKPNAKALDRASKALGEKIPKSGAPPTPDPPPPGGPAPPSNAQLKKMHDKLERRVSALEARLAS